MIICYKVVVACSGIRNGDEASLERCGDDDEVCYLDEALFVEVHVRYSMCAVQLFVSIFARFFVN